MTLLSPVPVAVHVCRVLPVCWHCGRMTHELIKAYGLQQHMRTYLIGAQWQPARQLDITRFHTDSYVAFLQALAYNGASVAEDATNYLLNMSVCFTETAWCAIPVPHHSLSCTPCCRASPAVSFCACEGCTRPHTRVLRWLPRKALWRARVT